MVEGLKELGLMKGNAEDGRTRMGRMLCSIPTDWDT